ncbi:YraN family protein [Aliifodinibius sp. S!AR15-10]|uniref:YraN family protein n=1 Tax=Aliifodinibius sp. S!AR15-10 TaxID=2950437 RepID=UPI0028664A3C|nr:YraN family protein [Aliifodinibius sp. S!AR15-10]MDR8394186.1 YraN family protein [Aliifodinibius sp. S!AR15-10]
MMTSKSSREIGHEGEELAASYLESKEYTILERNYFFEHAEVDIVAYDEKQIVFVEVKYRSDTDFGEPEDSISEEKQKNIFKAAEAWLYERKMDGSPVRFDVISIVQREEEAPQFKHFENAFWLTN